MTPGYFANDSESFVNDSGLIAPDSGLSREAGRGSLQAVSTVTSGCFQSALAGNSSLISPLRNRSMA